MTAKYRGKKVPHCPECGSPMILQTDEKYTYNSGRPKKFFRCERYPECRGRHSAHPDGTPVGVPVKEEVRALRKYVHVLATQIWGEWSDEKGRAAMYEWLGANTKSGHIGKMLEPELRELEEKLIKLTANLNQ